MKANSNSLENPLDYFTVINTKYKEHNPAGAPNMALMLKIYLTKKIDSRDKDEIYKNVRSLLIALETNLDWVTKANKDSDIKMSSYLDGAEDTASSHLLNCVNQPVLGVIIISAFFLLIASAKEMSDKIELGRELIVIDEIIKIAKQFIDETKIPKNPAAEYLEAELINVLLREVCKNLSKSEEWPAIPERITDEEMVSSWLGENFSDTTLLAYALQRSQEIMVCDASEIAKKLPYTHFSAWAEAACAEESGKFFTLKSHLMSESFNEDGSHINEDSLRVLFEKTYEGENFDKFCKASYQSASEKKGESVEPNKKNFREVIFYSLEQKFRENVADLTINSVAKIEKKPSNDFLPKSTDHVKSNELQNSQG